MSIAFRVCILEDGEQGRHQLFYDHWEEVYWLTPWKPLWQMTAQGRVRQEIHRNEIHCQPDILMGSSLIMMSFSWEEAKHESQDRHRFSNLAPVCSFTYHCFYEPHSPFFGSSCVHQQSRMDHHSNCARTSPGKIVCLHNQGFDFKWDSYCLNTCVCVSGCIGRPVQWEVRAGPQTLDRKLPVTGECRRSVGFAL